MIRGLFDEQRGIILELEKHLLKMLFFRIQEVSMS